MMMPIDEDFSERGEDVSTMDIALEAKGDRRHWSLLSQILALSYYLKIA